ncbi:MAG: cytochrome c4 [Burkholderiaceae bacterium]|nr:cytochrome c4 [Burkholderiaceae bacterium]
MTKPPAVLLAAALFAATASAADAPKPDPEKGAASFAGVCAACHGPDAGGIAALPTQPRLARQFPEYIAKQLTEFKSGVRDNAIMKPMASLLSDEDVLNVAAWVSAQKTAPAAAAPQAPEQAASAEAPAQEAPDLKLGERIYRGGIVGRSIPACSGCHSPNGAGIPAQYPHVAGQFPEYLTAQLTGFRDGVRKNNTIMTDVAAKLNDREIKALASYIAGMR